MTGHQQRQIKPCVLGTKGLKLAERQTSQRISLWIADNYDRIRRYEKLERLRIELKKMVGDYFKEMAAHVCETVNRTKAEVHPRHDRKLARLRGPSRTESREINSNKER